MTDRGATSGWVLELDPRRTKYLQYLIGAAMVSAGVAGIFGIYFYGVDSVGPVLFTIQVIVTVAGALWWCVGSWPRPSHLCAYLICSDVSLTIGVSVMPDQVSSIAGTALFVVTAMITVVATPLYVTGLHLAWSIGTLAVVTCRALTSHAADPSLIIAMALVTSIVFCSPTVLMIVVGELRSRARSALVDPLTGLANRRGLYAALDTLGYEIASGTSGLTVAVITLDIDGFKQINDRDGHHEGDAVLVHLAQRLTALGPDCRAVARLGGDEFACVLAGADASVDDCTTRLVTELRELQRSSALSVSMGVAATTVTGGDSDADVFDQLLRRADAEMYRAKRMRREPTSP